MRCEVLSEEVRLFPENNGDQEILESLIVSGVKIVAAKAELTHTIGFGANPVLPRLVVSIGKVRT